MNDRDMNHLHPALRLLAERWLILCRKQAIFPVIYYTYRSDAEQDELYAQGRTKKGRIVTNAKGGESKHNFTLDGKPASKAFDFFIERPDKSANWDPRSPEWQAAVAMGKQLGLKWGGDFRSFYDPGHMEIA